MRQAPSGDDPHHSSRFPPLKEWHGTRWRTRSNFLHRSAEAVSNLSAFAPIDRLSMSEAWRPAVDGANDAHERLIGTSLSVSPRAEESDTRSHLRRRLQTVRATRHQRLNARTENLHADDEVVERQHDSLCARDGRRFVEHSR